METKSLKDSGKKTDGSVWFWGLSRFMNSKPIGNNAYIPTNSEHIANFVSHGLWIIPSLLGVITLLERATDLHQVVIALVYGTSLTSLFAVSTTFHTVSWTGKSHTLRTALHISDRSIIYVFIAGSYTPWLNLHTLGSLGIHMRWVVWLLAIFGVSYSFCFHERFKRLEIALYLAIGIGPSIALFSMDYSPKGLAEVALGGLIYIVGVIFFKSDGVIPFAHAIWHLFVAVGAFFHYQAISTHLIGSFNVSNNLLPQLEVMIDKVEL